MFIFHQLRSGIIYLFIVIAVITTILTGCNQANKTKATDKPNIKIIDAAGLQKKYRSAAAKLTLPPGIIFPKKTETGGAQRFEDGVGIGNAQWYWIYAWEMEWLEQRGKDPERARKALDVLKNEVPKSELMKKMVDESIRTAYAEMLKKAELGDPSGFQNDVKVNPIKLLQSE